MVVNRRDGGWKYGKEKCLWLISICVWCSTVHINIEHSLVQAVVSQLCWLCGQIEHQLCSVQCLVSSVQLAVSNVLCAV